ncbi:MAG: YerC/YecD family TrpR-related protein [Candidatus Curtissbacteria bacterium]|nr:YerC/YecD family TrpR-related protein [Candidatus Curtissbacteria bacterium]
MAQVSKYPLNKETQTRLYKLLWQAIVALKEPIETEEFFNDLLTSTEKIMLAKRLAIAVMLIRGYDYESIRAHLRVSPGTINSVSTWLKYSGSGYKATVERLLKKEKVDNVFASIETALKVIKPEKTISRALAKGYPEPKRKEPF